MQKLFLSIILYFFRSDSYYRVFTTPSPRPLYKDSDMPAFNNTNATSKSFFIIFYNIIKKTFFVFRIIPIP